MQSLALLIIQTVNVTCMIGGLGPLIAKPCRWKQIFQCFPRRNTVDVLEFVVRGSRGNGTLTDHPQTEAEGDHDARWPLQSA